MSFSSDVKEELGKYVSRNKHCQIAEMAAILHFQGQLTRGDAGQLQLQILTENPSVLRKRRRHYEHLSGYKANR